MGSRQFGSGFVVHAGVEPAASLHPRIETEPDSSQTLLALFPDGDRLLQARSPGSVLRRVGPGGEERWSHQPVGGGYAGVALAPDEGIVYWHNSNFGMGAISPGGTQSWERRNTFYTDVVTDDAGRWLAGGYANPSTVIDVGRTGTGWETSSEVGPPACPWVRGAVFGAGDALYVLTSATSSVLGLPDCVIRATIGANGMTAIEWMATLDFGADIDQLAVGRDGSLFFGMADGTVVSLSPDGAERWRSTPTTTACTGPGSAPALGADGTIFHHAHGRLMALDGDGSVRWTSEVADPTGRPCWIFAPVLSDDGRLFVASWGYRIRAYRAGTTADPQAVWGQAGGDARRSRQARTGG
jgi:hypothetical protein